MDRRDGTCRRVPVQSHGAPAVRRWRDAAHLPRGRHGRALRDDSSAGPRRHHGRVRHGKLLDLRQQPARKGQGYAFHHGDGALQGCAGCGFQDRSGAHTSSRVVRVPEASRAGACGAHRARRRICRLCGEARHEQGGSFPGVLLALRVHGEVASAILRTARAARDTDIPGPAAGREHGAGRSSVPDRRNDRRAARARGSRPRIPLPRKAGNVGRSGVQIQEGTVDCARERRRHHAAVRCVRHCRQLQAHGQFGRRGRCCEGRRRGGDSLWWRRSGR